MASPIPPVPPVHGEGIISGPPAPGHSGNARYGSFSRYLPAFGSAVIPPANEYLPHLHPGGNRPIEPAGKYASVRLTMPLTLLSKVIRWIPAYGYGPVNPAHLPLPGKDPFPGHFLP